MKIRTIARLSGLILFVLILYLAAILAYGTWTDFQPPAELVLKTDQQATAETVMTDSIFSLISWNLGYGGLGEESEFFYDHGNMLWSGGRMVRAPRALVEKNNAGIRQWIGNAQADFFLLQEVDYESGRSYYANQYQDIAADLPSFSSLFAVNYQVAYVPIPIFEPWKAYGRTYSGLATYARHQPHESVRYQLPGAFSWPTRIFQLDRCVSLHRFRLKGEKELVLINLHLSAYDADGALKQQQMNYLRDLVLAEYGKGHYVIAGGDWNLCPPYFRFDGFMPGRTQGYTQINIEPDFLPVDWKWAYDPDVPTNRKIRTPYVPGETFITTIDFFLLSPNVRLREVKTIDQQFRFSDHQPVWVEVELE